ncbi:hypothetical protein BB561_006052 [Smittium simulii]|uniref:Tyr recombinase domain-containing protein n=1 Tax=Smittium simulii TaxID=133385 RepID=A0A2T9Y6T7_9FUNG|nr:hypothetical protein BB561_006052 [Smittium simulii]
MEQELIQLIKDLSDKVNILYNEREANSTHQEQEMKVQSSSGKDPYLRARAPINGLGISGDITALDIINYLSKIFIERKLKQFTMQAYKSALLQLVTDKKRVEKEKCFIEFMKFLNESDLIKVTNNFINIKPIIGHFKILCPTNSLNTKELTAKTCWLIAVCGFLRASDIHQVDNERTEILNNSIKLIICAPKEKRKSSPIERLVEIKAHSDKILCPEIAYKIHKQIIANIPCPRPHVNNRNLIVNHLFRNTKDFNKLLTVDSIPRIIKSIPIIAVKDEKGITPKARAIGATIAARTGISTDAIITQENWSSYYMFISYYKLSNDSYSNITESVLAELT